MSGVTLITGSGFSAGPWTSMTLNAALVGDSPGTFSGFAQGCRLEGDGVRLRGQIATIAEVAENSELFKLPESVFFPAKSSALTTTFGNGPGALTPIRLLVQATGIVKVLSLAANLPSGKILPIDGLWFPLK